MNCTPQQEQAITAQLVAMGFHDYGSSVDAGFHNLAGIFADTAPLEIHVGFQDGHCFIGAMDPIRIKTTPLLVSTTSTIAILRTIMGVLL